MKSLFRVFGLCLAAAALISAAPAPTPSPEGLSSQVDQVFAELARKDSPGCALAVVRDGRIVYSKGYGMASLEHSVPISPQTVFDIGSTSKQVTAAAILLLAQEGKLSLDDDVRKHIPEIPDYGTPVTLRHLLHHTAGIRDYIALLRFAGINFEDVATDADALAAIARQKSLDFRPGDEHSYSNSGYFLLSLVVKRASGKTLREFAEERIFKPLDMASTQILDDHTRIIPRRAASYGPTPSGFQVVSSNWEQTGDGAVQTAVEDLAKWDQNFYDPKVGGPGLIEQLQVTGMLNDGEKITYARGLQVDEHRGLRRVSHGGGWAGYRAEMIRFPDARFSVITLCNAAHANPTAMAMQVANLYLADRLQPAREVASPGSAPAGPAAAAVQVDGARYAGLFWNPVTDTVRRIVARDGKLFYERGPGNETELAPLGGDRFAMVGAPAKAEVLFPAASPGAAREMQVIIEGNKPSVFRVVEQVTPTEAELAAYAGRYSSEELDVTYTLAVEDGKLTLRDRRGESLRLEPAFADAFRNPNLGLLRFSRDSGKKVNGFSISVGRARNMRFTKAPSP
ncbi:MAG TPA: serine hydrolase domain-containing protein [Thermoanaerobaculia bacterium]